jgi:hypothetical protein
LKESRDGMEIQKQFKSHLGVKHISCEGGLEVGEEEGKM